MPHPPLPTSTPPPPPSSRTPILSSRSSSSEHPLIPLYAILGIVGGVLALLVLAFTLLLGGCCCRRQARKAYQSAVGDRPHTTLNTYNHGHWHGHLDRPTSTLAVHAGPHRPQYIQAPPSESHSVSPIPRKASLEHHTPRLALPYPTANPIDYLQRSGSYASRFQARKIHRSPPSPLSKSESIFVEHHPGHSRCPDMYTSRSSQFDRPRQSRSPSPLPLVRLGSTSSHRGRYDYYPPASSKPRYDGRSRRPSRERSERRASRPEEWASRTSDGTAKASE